MEADKDRKANMDTVKQRMWTETVITVVKNPARKCRVHLQWEDSVKRGHGINEYNLFKKTKNQNKTQINIYVQVDIVLYIKPLNSTNKTTHVIWWSACFYLPGIYASNCQTGTAINCSDFFFFFLTGGCSPKWKIPCFPDVLTYSKDRWDRTLLMDE